MRTTYALFTLFLFPTKVENLTFYYQIENAKKILTFEWTKKIYLLRSMGNVRAEIATA